MLPLLGVKPSLRSKMSTRAYLISSGGQLSERWCNSIEQLSILENLQAFTLREANSLKGIAPITSAQSRKWCPACLEEDLANPLGPYDRLLWTISEVEACPKHQTRLEHSCPHCGQTKIPVLSARDCSGFCPYCLNWLGVKPITLDPDRDEHTRYLLWCARSFSDLLDSPIPIDIDAGSAIRNMLHGIAQHHFSGRTTHLARALGRNKSVISTWLTSNGRVSWRAICEISYVFHVPVSDLLTCESDAIAFSMLRSLPLAKSNAGRRQRKIAVRHDRKHILDFFEAIEKGHYPAILTLEAVATRLNTSSRELRRIFQTRFKDLGKTLEVRRLRAQQIKAQQRKELLEREVPAAIYRVLDRGERLSRRAISNELSCIGVGPRRSEQPFITRLTVKTQGMLSTTFVSGN